MDKISVPGDMGEDQFKREIDWVQGYAGEDRLKAGSVVAWQAVTATLNELVKHFNRITFNPKEPEKRRYREVQLKKVMIGMLYEMDACLDFWAGKLMVAKLLDQTIVDKKKEFKTACKKVGLDVLKKVRNGVAFHFTDHLVDPDAIVETYQKIDQISPKSISEILCKANHCGSAMQKKVIDSIGTTKLPRTSS